MVLEPSGVCFTQGLSFLILHSYPVCHPSDSIDIQKDALCSVPLWLNMKNPHRIHQGNVTHIYLPGKREKSCAKTYNLKHPEEISFHFWRALVHLSLKLQQQDIYAHTHTPQKTQQDGELHAFPLTGLFFLFPWRDQKDETFLSKLVAL